MYVITQVDVYVFFRIFKKLMRMKTQQPSVQWVEVIYIEGGGYFFINGIINHFSLLLIFFKGDSGVQ